MMVSTFAISLGLTLLASAPVDLSQRDTPLVLCRASCFGTTGSVGYAFGYGADCFSACEAARAQCYPYASDGGSC